jgi:hypothetical protein
VPFTRREAPCIRQCAGGYQHVPSRNDKSPGIESTFAGDPCGRPGTHLPS